MSLIVPTSLSEEQIREYQELIKNHSGIQLSREEALKEGLELIEFIAVIVGKKVCHSISDDPVIN